MKKYFFMVAVLLSLKGFSQGSTDYGAGLKFNLNEDGLNSCVDQIWFRSAEMNRNNDWWRASINCNRHW
jgi:hypothetical protein